MLDFRLSMEEEITDKKCILIKEYYWHGFSNIYHRLSVKYLINAVEYQINFYALAHEYNVIRTACHNKQNLYFDSSISDTDFEQIIVNYIQNKYGKHY